MKSFGKASLLPTVIVPRGSLRDERSRFCGRRSDPLHANSSLSVEGIASLLTAFVVRNDSKRPTPPFGHPSLRRREGKRAARGRVVPGRRGLLTSSRFSGFRSWRSHPFGRMTPGPPVIALPRQRQKRSPSYQQRPFDVGDCFTPHCVRRSSRSDPFGAMTAEDLPRFQKDPLTQSWSFAQTFSSPS